MMTALNLITFMSLLFGGFILLKLTPMDMAKSFSMLLQNTFLSSDRKQPIKKKINEVKRGKGPKGLERIVVETVDILNATNKNDQFALLCLIALVLMTLGALMSFSLGNLLLLPILCVGLALIPYWYIKFTAILYKRDLNAELETALSAVTTSYLRSESIITAMEENIEYINPPILGVFKTFLNQSKLINSNVRLALKTMKPKIDNDIFHEWVDSLIACQDDKNLKTTLVPIVGKLSDVRIVSSDLDYLMYQPLKEYITMAFLTIGVIPIMYVANKEWYNILLYHPVGKGILAFTCLVMFVSLAAVIRLTKPIEYRKVRN